MTALTLRNTKGAPVTYSELDANFTALDAAKTDKSANLSDVANAATALSNLGGIPTSQKGVASGVATLDATGKIPMSQISGFVQSTSVGAASGVAALDSNGKLPTSYLQSYVLTSAVGAASGIATLDSGGKVPVSQMPTSYATSSYVDTAISTLTGGVANQLVASSKVQTPQVGLADATQSIYFDATLKEPILEVRGFKFKFMGGYLQCVNKTRQILAAGTGAGATGQAAATFVVPAGVNFIFVKMWGAGGGGGSYGGWRQGSAGGGGGYSHAIIPVTPGETITYRVGQCGWGRPGAAKAWPDGGGASTTAGDNQYAANGGGSTSMHVPSLGGYIMYAGGGGGGGCVNGYAVQNGGAGGGINGQRGIFTHYGSSNVGGGGSQFAGGVAGATGSTAGQAGAKDQGGTNQGACYGGGGGGGYYGGGSGSYVGSSMGGGGGGSGHVNGALIMAATIAGCGAVPGAYGDPDLQAANGPSYSYAMGADEDGFGGPGLLVVYY